MTDLLDVMLGQSKFCGECSAELPEPGVPCVCGQVPPVTRQEAAEALKAPGAVAAAEAARDREHARDLQKDVAEALASADRRLFIAGLEQELTAADADAATAVSAVEAAKAAVANAQARKQDAVAREDDSRSNSPTLPNKRSRPGAPGPAPPTAPMRWCGWDTQARCSKRIRRRPLPRPGCWSRPNRRSPPRSSAPGSLRRRLGPPGRGWLTRGGYHARDRLCWLTCPSLP